MKDFRGPDGTPWRVEVRTPGSSNAMIVFNHPDARSSSRNRYAWYISNGPEARNVTARLSPEQVLESLGDRDLARFFRRSMPVSTGIPRPAPNAAGGKGGW
jgi:hypothetical protein